MRRTLNSRYVSASLLVGLFMFIVTGTFAKTAQAFDAQDLATFKNGGAIALMRHAIAPGNGDPTDFKIGDCSTQRNLSADGVIQSQKIGLQFKEQGVGKLAIYSSQWCRCIDTATHLGLGSVIQLPILNSFYQDRSTEQQQTSDLSQWIVNRLSNNSANLNTQQPNTTPAILVTHQVNITALTGVFPRSGEVVFVSLENSELRVLSTWLHDD